MHYRLFEPTPELHLGLSNWPDDAQVAANGVIHSADMISSSRRTKETAKLVKRYKLTSTRLVRGESRSLGYTRGRGRYPSIKLRYFDRLLAQYSCQSKVMYTVRCVIPIESPEWAVDHEATTDACRRLVYVYIHYMITRPRFWIHILTATNYGYFKLRNCG
ncbi:hypothetical protein BJ165DRAFT_1471069 [Panaeolus papilionaceus]|nr:hypothetical protein BJ165DRAFT_1471069 [Panaeolus papilionaceus]